MQQAYVHHPQTSVAPAEVSKPPPPVKQSRAIPIIDPRTGQNVISGLKNEKKTEEPKEMGDDNGQWLKPRPKLRPQWMQVPKFKHMPTIKEDRQLEEE
jgi:hypothetical protein